MLHRVSAQPAARDRRIARVATTILDVPIRRNHKLSGVTMTHQSYLLVEIETEGGLIGYGEGVTPGGPWWSGESIETMKALIDGYLAPAVVGLAAGEVQAARMAMNRVAARSPFAKAALEMALWDLAAKVADQPLSALFGGPLREGVALRWALATGDLEIDLAEAHDYLARDLARSFKIKGGAKSPAEDLAHARALREALGPDVSLQIDLNNVWDLPTALDYGPALMEVVDYLEQPVQGWNRQGLAELRRQGIRVMADESLFTPQDAMEMAQIGAVDIFALKPMKSAGLAETRTIAGIAEAAGIQCYAGTFMESSLGISAHLHLSQTLPALVAGGELLGGLWLAEDITETGVTYRDGHVYPAPGPGHGVTPDPARVAAFKRD